MKRTIAAATALALTTMIGAPAFAAEPSVAGFWEVTDTDGKVGAWFVFEKKDDVYVGRLAKGFPKPGEKNIKTCEYCPDERKGARMMGLTIVYGMKRDGLHYDEGMILDPRSGSMYHAEMDLSEDGKELSVRGYLMIKALGQTQVWHRLPDDAIKKEDVPKEVLATAADPKAEGKGLKAEAKVSKHDAKAVKHDVKPTPEPDVAQEPAK
jgi:uncharacterized protein (DUF2147 family)